MVDIHPAGKLLLCLKRRLLFQTVPISDVNAAVSESRVIRPELCGLKGPPRRWLVPRAWARR
jgi:hypothetical protein